MNTTTYTIEEAAALLGRSTNSVSSAARRLALGVLVSIEGIGTKRRMFSAADLEALKAVGRQPGNPLMRDPDKARELQARGVAKRLQKGL